MISFPVKNEFGDPNGKVKICVLMDDMEKRKVAPELVLFVIYETDSSRIQPCVMSCRAVIPLLTPSEVHSAYRDHLAVSLFLSPIKAGKDMKHLLPRKAKTKCLFFSREVHK